MQTEEIVKLTRKRIAAIVKARQESGKLTDSLPGPERRHHPRWPFKGAVELWPDGTGARSQLHGTCLNISETGVGLSCDKHLQPGDIMEVAVHLPEMSLCGRAAVRYCAQVRGQYMVGLEFLF
jgi:hypothetical protein